MGNMSYCRFENTSGDLIDCREAIENGEMSVEMSQHERDGLEILLDACEEIYHLKDDIEDALKRWDDNDEEMKREEEEAQKRWEEEEQAKKRPHQITKVIGVKVERTARSTESLTTNWFLHAVTRQQSTVN